VLEDVRFMLVRVTCAGALIGTAEFDPPHGVAHASLVRAAGYDVVSPAARLLARSLAHTQCCCSGRDFADVAATRWEGGRLALEDETGRELAANNVVVIESIPGGPGEAAIRVVADFRRDLGSEPPSPGSR
jgi:hypothetical protein